MSCQLIVYGGSSDGMLGGDDDASGGVGSGDCS